MPLKFKGEKLVNKGVDVNRLVLFLFYCSSCLKYEVSNSTRFLYPVKFLRWKKLIYNYLNYS